MGAHPAVNYFYFGRDIWSKHRGIATVGVVPDYEKRVAKVAFAFCSPDDAFRRYTEPSMIAVRKHIDDPDNPGRKMTVAELVPNPNQKPGGVDIVNARLGLVPMDEKFKVGPKFVEVPMPEGADPKNGAGLLGAALDAFNKIMPMSQKPRLWKHRRLVYGRVLFIALANAKDYGESLAATALLYHNKERRTAAFVPAEYFS